MLNRPLKRWAPLLLLCAISGVIAYFAMQMITIRQTPKTVMTLIEKQLQTLAGGYNKCQHVRQYGPRARSVARANPDSIVSFMAYDVSQGPILVRGEIWPAYWSLSVYQHNTDNIFVVNDKQLDTTDYMVVIAHKDSAIELPKNAILVQSPTPTGIVLIRRFVASKAEMDAVHINQDQMTCGQYAAPSS